MSLRTYLVVALALVFGISSAMGINLLIEANSGRGNVEKVSVVVAAADLAPLVPLTDKHLELKEMPKDMAPPGALTRLEEAIGRVPKIKMAKNDYIFDQLLSEKGSKTVGAAIPVGKRAIPIQNSGVSAFIQPGDKVDILLTLKEKSGEHRAITLFTLIDVMAVNGSLVPSLDNKTTDGKEPQNVNVLLTQEQAEDLERGQKNGTIRLALRSPGDNTPAIVTKLADLKVDVTHEEQAPPAPFEPAPPQIRTLKGSESGVIVVQSPKR